MERDSHYSSPKAIEVNDNERSYVIQLISEINEYLRNRDISFKRAGGERTINGGAFVKFPDVLLFSDRGQSLILQGWEAKCPDVSIDNEAFVKDAHEKAMLLGCNSTVLWNFQYAQLHVCDAEGNFQIAERWTIDSRIVNRASIALYEKEWKESLHLLIDKISEYVATGKIKHRSLGETLTGTVMPSLINENKGLVSDFLKQKSARDVTVKAHIESWWASVKKEYMHDENDPFLAYSKNILVNWLNKLMFANTIQNQFEAARRVSNIIEGYSIQQALVDFNYITENCDFYNVFAQLPYADFLPPATWSDLVSFNQLLLECEMKQLESDYTHKILEQSISVMKRQIAGQYPTPNPIAKLMSEIAVRDAYGAAWDCCCGTGTIGCSIWNRKIELLEGIEQDAKKVAYNTTWMSDIHDFPLQIATLSFSSLSPIKCPLLVTKANVFDMKVGAALPFVEPNTGDKIEYKVPLFNSIISNLPFVDFNTTEISWYTSIKESLKEKYSSLHHVTLSDRNDLYSYIALYLNDLLADDGHVCLLTSNSWLCTSSGDGFMLALQSTFDIDSIYVNGKARWFKNADVMNAILVLKKKLPGAKPQSYLGVINASVDDLDNDCIRGSVSRSVISHEWDSNNHLSETLLSWEQMSRLKSLGLSYYAMCHNVSFMPSLIEKLCSIESIFDVNRGIKSGQDSFFYSSEKDFVEEPFRCDLLKNFEDVKTFELKPSWYAFKCDKSTEYLEQNGFNKALSRITAVTKQNKSVKNHTPYWYTLPASSEFTFATTMNPGGRLFFAGAPEGKPFVANQRAICLAPLTSDFDRELCLALLNSTLGMFLIEASAAPMALGALDTRSETFKKMYMLNPTIISPNERNVIVEAFKPLKNREILDALDELEQVDRQDFDTVIMDVYGIAEFYNPIKNALQGMLNARLR